MSYVDLRIRRMRSALQYLDHAKWELMIGPGCGDVFVEGCAWMLVGVSMLAIPRTPPTIDGITVR